MNIINNNDKKRLIDFINENNLDLEVVDNGISRFGISTSDKKVFFVYEYNNQYVLCKYDPDKELQSILSGNAGVMYFEYFYYQNMQQVLEQLSFYEKSIYKSYWEPIRNTFDIPFIKEDYFNEWISDFTGDNWTTESWNDDYDYLVYNEERNIKVHSPFNTLHEVSLFNSYSPEDLDRLYMEVHPISLKEKSESYLVKILINKEDILKEYINYKVSTKKGLNLFLNELFSGKNPNVIFS